MFFLFQSTHPLRGATSRSASWYVSDKTFQSTHPLRGATPVAVNLSVARLISIHAPLAGCDASHRRDNARHGYFNPRTPCGVRLILHLRRAGHILFQSTHPLRGATRPSMQAKTAGNISIHAPLAGCDESRRSPAETGLISIHAPLAGCDKKKTGHKARRIISIHAPLAGCDPRYPARRPTPGGFQSTHPLRGATRPPDTAQPRFAISIHAPLAGCDSVFVLSFSASIDFNPRTPCGVRRLQRA